MERDTLRDDLGAPSPGAHALWLAARGLAATAAPLWVAGLSAAPVRTAACASRCRCAEWREGVARVAEAAALLGLTAVPAPADRLLRSGRWGSPRRPFVWLEPRRAGALTVFRGRAVLEGVDLDGAGYRVEPSVDDAERAVILAVQRTARPRAGRHERVTHALADWAALGRRPALPGGCPRVALPCESATGLAAYGVWLRGLSLSARGGGESRVDALRARAWQRARWAGAAFLRAVAGAGRDPAARRLLRAADLLEREARDVLGPVGDRLAARRRSEARRLLAPGEALFDAALELVAEAVLMRMGAPAGAEECLLGDPEAILEGSALQEVIYLARAGARPFRQLAARRLAGARAAQASATLRELLFDRDAAVAETALWALLRGGGDEAVRVASRSYGSVPRVRAPGEVPLQRALLVETVLRGAPEAEALLDAARSDAGEGDPEPRALRALAMRLTAARRV
ncbi:MAG TPA: hypothetical protein VLH79_02900 [Chthonomonadales bacterium]|nr:hypothetical protein [Chthonomonadales bacterium]